MQWLDRDGATQPLITKPGRYLSLHLSPDGQRLAFEEGVGSNRDIWISAMQPDSLTRLTFDAGGLGNMNPVWSPDGRYIVFGGKGGIFWTRSDGAGKPRPLTQSNGLQVPYSFTPDGKRISLVQVVPGGGSDLWTLAIENDGTGLKGLKPEVFLETSFDERYPTFSPDGSWLAYTSNESGTYEIYVRAFPDGGAKQQISYGGGAYPVWSRNGRQLLFRSLDSRFMTVAYTVKGDSFVAEKPSLWSDKRFTDFVVGFGSYDVTPDGKRVFALVPVEGREARQAQNHVIFLENFFDELSRKVPLR